MIQEKINHIKKISEKYSNDITISLVSDFLNWFIEKLNLNFNSKSPNLKYKKWEVYFVNLWQNIWSELNKTRPCIIYSKKSFNSKNSVIIIPLKSFKWKIIDKFQIKIEKDEKNKLIKDSICDIFHIKNISTKRIWLKKWEINLEKIKQIDNKIIKMFDLKIKNEE